MATGGIGNQSPATLFQARLDTTDGVSNTLNLKQYKGNKAVVSGMTVPIPALGLTRLVTDHLIDAGGADAGAAGVASTLYYVYVSNQKASFSPSSIRLSATPPILVNGVRYLGAAGNSLNWRFVGWVKLNATPQFESSQARRFIVNYYNRLSLSLFTCPGYVDGSGTLTFVIATATFTEVNGGVGSRVNFISNGEDAISLRLITSMFGLGADTVYMGPGVDSGTALDCIGFSGGGANETITVDYDKSLPEGDHFIAMIATDGGGSGAGTAEIQQAAAFAGNTSGHDIPITMIRGTVQG
jgi:hypothetical protein